MAKKKHRASKTEATKSKKRKDPVSWSSALESIQINDESWSCQVSMIVESIADQSKYISLLNSACEEGIRSCIYCLSYDKMIRHMELLSHDNLEQCPPAQGVCHYADKVFSENGSLPTALIAQVIKYLIHVEKLNSIARIEEEANVGPDRLVCRRGDSAQVNSELDTKSTEHNEEWQQLEQQEHLVVCTINDAPLNGPNLYVILTGFRESDLPRELISASVPLTSILRMKHDESLDETVPQYMEKRLIKPRRAVDNVLLKFWSVLDEQKDKTEEPFDSIALLAVSIPEAKIHDTEIDIDQLKMELYDRVSFTLYEIFELRRAHGNYLNSMKVEECIFDETRRISDRELYQCLLDSVPQEYVTVAFILNAILAQAVMDCGKASIADNQAKIASKGESEIQYSQTELKSDGKTAETVEKKVKKLNVAYDIDEEFNCDDETFVESDPEVVLYRDSLSMINRYLSSNEELPETYKSTDIVQDILRILQDNKILKAWNNYEKSDEKVKKYSIQLGGIQNFFHEELNSEEVQHYLHMLIFERMMFNGSLPKGKIGKGDETFPELSSREHSAPKRSKSDITLTLKPERTPPRSKSDGLIHHGKSVSTFADCSVLLELTDPRELLQPGYLQEHILSKRRSCSLPLQEFEFVELLSNQVFAQIIYECMINYEHFESVYFEPTDTILLRFFNEYEFSKVTFEESISRLKTPMCFREFCDHVMDVGEWMGCGPETCELRKMPASLIEKSTLDAKNQKSNISSARTEHNKNAVVDGAGGNNKKSKKKSKKERRLSASAKQKAEEIESEKTSLKQEKETAKNIVGNDSSTSRAAEKEKPYAFIGYDLGRLRVQVSNRKTNFLAADGTLVRVEVEHWLHWATDLRILLTIRDASLRFHRGISHRQISDPFHLTTGNGIILAFQPVPKVGDNWYPTSFDFQASLPSGLTIKLVAGDSGENPFYIQQSLLTKNRHDYHVNREVCRKFLRNGTVLKYLDDGTIRVLRPNGDVVTCLEFRRLQREETSRFTNETSTQKGEIARETLSGREKTETKPLKSEVSGSFRGSGLFKKRDDSITADQTPASVSTVTEVPARLEVSRYKVLNHEGRRYEVLDERLVSEQHRLLVRIDTDYQVNEKLIRRDDGTNMLLNSDGEFIVIFPDGTRIITGYIIEESLLTCEWTAEEFDWYLTTGDGFSQFGESVSTPDTKFDEETCRKSSTGRSSKMTEIADGFVSVLLTCRIEHKNYATVSYDQSALSCTISMPGDLRVSISACGHYEVSMEHLNLKILENNVTLCSKRHDTCNAWSTASYNFIGIDTARNSRTIFTITDALGNLFEVDENGTTYYENESRAALMYGSGLSEDLSPCQCNLNLEPSGIEGNQHPSKIECHRYTVGRKFPYKEEARWHCLECKNDSRIFAVNRDLTAYEYVHRSQTEKLEQARVSDNKTSMILYSISRRPELRRLITLEPVEVESRSKPPQHRFLLERTEQTKFGRGGELLPSTYSRPYDWPYPFGEKGHGISENSHDVSLSGSIRRTIPKLLKIRILYGFQGPTENPLIEMQHALASYWLSLFGSSEQYPSVCMRDEVRRTREKVVVPAYFKNFEDDLRDLALAIKTSIDGSAYVKGLQALWKIEVEKPARELSRAVATAREQRVRDAEEFNWYRNCLRQKFILPYFQNIPGACFLWMEEVISSVLGSSTPSAVKLSSINEEEALNEEILIEAY